MKKKSTVDPEDQRTLRKSMLERRIWEKILKEEILLCKKDLVYLFEIII